MHRHEEIAIGIGSGNCSSRSIRKKPVRALLIIISCFERRLRGNHPVQMEDVDSFMHVEDFLTYFLNRAIGDYRRFQFRT